MKQLTILADNNVGSLAEILGILGSKNINITGIISERGPLAEIRLIVDQPDEAKEHLEHLRGYVVHLVDVVKITLDSTSGSLAKVAKLLQKQKINVDYIYGLDTAGDQADIILHTSENPDKVRQLLKDYKVE